MAQKLNKELKEFRQIIKPPKVFNDGFNWSSILGAIFIGLMMVPGAVYMGLVAGEGVAPAAQWVSVILFIEVARRIRKDLKRPEIYVVFYMVGAMMAMPFGGLLFNQFYMRSDAAIAYGISELLPKWYAPSLDSDSYVYRTFLHKDWLPVIFLMLFQTIIGRVKYMTLGYGFFRLTSDVEHLPFPMAPVGASGVMALADDMDEKMAESKENSWQMGIFSIGGAIGLAFGFIYLFLPIFTGALLEKPIMLIPIPFVEWSHKTAGILPAVATGISLNLLHFFTGMVLPFYAVLGKIIGLIVTFILNPILYKMEVLTSWVPGDDTVVTTFKNSVDFYFSFTIGISIAVAVVGLITTFKIIINNRKKKNLNSKKTIISAEYLKRRGDVSRWLIAIVYFFVTMSYILVSGWLIDWHRGVMMVLFFLGFVYIPFTSYVTARIEGVAGASIRVPYMMQAAMILSGYHGVKVWFLPIPMSNYGDNEVVLYRQSELTGTKFSSIWKTEFIVMPIILIASIVYMSYIWGLGEIPSAVYPFAEKMWDLKAAQLSIMYSSTLSDYSIFEDAFKWLYVYVGLGSGIVLFGAMSWIGAPVFLAYGFIQGMGETIPHVLFLQFFGALVGRYYFYKRKGLLWRQYAPVVTAGFACGMGLIATLGVGISFLTKAVIKLPF